MAANQKAMGWQALTGTKRIDTPKERLMN